MGQRGS